MTMHTKLYNNTAVQQALKAAVYNSDQLCAEVDMQGYQDFMALVNVGLSADTLNGSNYILLELQHSDTSGSGYAACADADIVNPVTGATTGTFAKIDAAAEDELPYFTAYKGTKRYLKVNVNFVGTHSTGTPIGVQCLKGSPQAMPVNS